MQTDEPSFEEIPRTHPIPSVIIGIADDETRQDEEKIFKQRYGMTAKEWRLTNKK